MIIEISNHIIQCKIDFPTLKLVSKTIFQVNNSLLNVQNFVNWK